MRNNKCIPAYAALQAVYWMSYGCIFSFTAVFLLDHGFSDSAIGALIALSCLLSVMLQPHIAAAADRGKHFTLKKLFTLICTVEIIPAIILAFIPLPVFIVAILYGVMIVCCLSVQPLLSALGMQLIQQQIPVNFGVSRGLGSFGYAVLAFFLGSLTVILSTSCLPVIGSVLMVIIIILLRVFPESDASGEAAVAKGGAVAVIRRNPAFALLIAGIILMFISHSACNNYMIQILNNIGEGNEALGRINAYAALLEVPAMLLCTRILRRIKCSALLRISAAFFLIKVLGIALASSLPMLYIALGAQALSFAPFTAAIVYYVSDALPKGDQVKGQALITIGITSGNVLGSLIGGYLLEYLGVLIMLRIFCGVCAIGMILFLMSVRSKKTQAA